jgi:hypothetical protein
MRSDDSIWMAVVGNVDPVGLLRSSNLSCQAWSHLTPVGRLNVARQHLAHYASVRPSDRVCAVLVAKVNGYCAQPVRPAGQAWSDVEDFGLGFGSFLLLGAAVIGIAYLADR